MTTQDMIIARIEDRRKRKIRCIICGGPFTEERLRMAREPMICSPLCRAKNNLSDSIKNKSLENLKNKLKNAKRQFTRVLLETLIEKEISIAYLSECTGHNPGTIRGILDETKNFNWYTYLDICRCVGYNVEINLVKEGDRP
jgi:hypothetical protein